MERLLSDGNHVDLIDESEAIVPYWALLGNGVATTRLLLGKGADANRPRLGFSLRQWPIIDGFRLPITLATYQGNCANIESLLRHGANIDKHQPRVYGPTTALASALYGRHEKAADLPAIGSKGRCCQRA
ncbi:hypothetical protein OEA41_003450 [Lepraria neglecta]|uniref:Ankyrin repeat domain-containing protein n=1 Tax=Lepraria neglecta TaxID=209136 RepID=A0AAD9Z5R3_9LECA|nr:hypothetical protein OEA41_003450 [Lepraria neglecta]